MKKFCIIYIHIIKKASDFVNTMDRKKKSPIIYCVGIFVICSIARIIEYFFIRTDESILAENFLHKLFGIILLCIIIAFSKYKWSDIGFSLDGFAKQTMKGILLGTACFAISYSIECAILYIKNGNVALSFYACGFSLNGKMEHQMGIVSILLCIAFNIVNVWMEEGVFRGLFTKILEDIPYNKSIFLIAFLFGIWHWVMPFRDYIDGNSTIANLLVMGIGYIVLAGIMSLKWSLLYKMTGSIWMGLGDHLFNNVIVTNLVHVISNNEADTIQIVRIMIGQLLSFVIVLIVYHKNSEMRHIY